MTDTAHLQDYLDDATSRFATVALVDTNGLLRGQMVSVSSLKGILKNGMGMAPAQLALDPTDEMLEMPGVTRWHRRFPRRSPDRRSRHGAAHPLGQARP